MRAIAGFQNGNIGAPPSLKLGFIGGHALRDRITIPILSLPGKSSPPATKGKRCARFARPGSHFEAHEGDLG